MNTRWTDSYRTHDKRRVEVPRAYTYSCLVVDGSHYTCISICISTYSESAQLRAPLLGGMTKRNIRARRQKLAQQKLPWQKFSSHLPGREDARKISVIVSKRYRCIPPPCTVWLFGDNCDTYAHCNRICLLGWPCTRGDGSGCPSSPPSLWV